MLGSFLTGVITGGVLVAMFGRRVFESIDAKTRATRFRVADTVGRAAEGLETAREVIEGGLTGDERGRERAP
jgi:hypothetical protein